MPGKACKACVSKDRDQIDLKIREGWSDRRVASHYGLSATGIGRHKDHLRGPAELLRAGAAALEAGKPEEASAKLSVARVAIEGAPARLLQTAEWGQRAARRVSAKAEKTLDLGAAVAGIGAAVKSADLEAKLVGAYAPVKQQVEHSGQVGVIVLPAEDREWVPGAVVEAQVVAADASADAVARQLLEPGDPLREWWSREVERGHLVITGAPRTGKTTLADALGARLGVRVLHTDDLQHLGWGADSDEGAKWMLEAEPWIIEGTAAVRSLRKHVKAGGGERPVCIYLTAPRVQQTAGQVAMARGIETIWLQVVEAVERIQPPRELA